MNNYNVRKDGESLAARLVDEDGTRRIELTYEKANGDIQVSTFEDGMRVSSSATHATGMYPSGDSEGNTTLSGNLATYQRLGPELRTQIPSDWHSTLGTWLASKE